MEAFPSADPQDGPPLPQSPDTLPPPAAAPSDAPIIICLATGLRDGFAGGIMGSVFGFGQGLWKRQGFKGSLKEAGSSAKMFALLSGVHTLVSCCLRKVRGKHDALNAGIAGCATGLALSTPGSPGVLLRSCVTFALFSFFIERFSKPQAAIAASLDLYPACKEHEQIAHKFSFHVLPPFVLPPSCLDSLESSSHGKVGLYTKCKW